MDNNSKITFLQQFPLFDILNHDEIDNLIAECKEQFNSALEDDFNTHLALTAFFKLIKEVNRLAAEESLSKKDVKKIMPEFERLMDILGLEIPKISKQEIDSINDMITQRDTFRSQKKYQEADKIRDKISQMNIELIDHKSRTVWMKKEKIKSEN